jgi:hypothetical protein
MATLTMLANQWLAVFLLITGGLASVANAFYLIAVLAGRSGLSPQVVWTSLLLAAGTGASLTTAVAAYRGGFRRHAGASEGRPSP